MRFYRKRQAQMLHSIALLLKKEQQMLASKAPALGEFIEEFLEKDRAIQEHIIGHYSREVRPTTLDKSITRSAFEDIVMELSSGVMAANSRNKNAPAGKKYYTRAALKKITAAALCKEYLDLSKALKKIRNLEFYGLSRYFLADAQAYYKEFSAVKNMPAQRKKQVAAGNKKADELIKECMLLLKYSIDPLMRIATKDNKELAAIYFGRSMLPRRQGRPKDEEVAYRKSRAKKKE